jgi:PAS domain S-box-containing protein
LIESEEKNRLIMDHSLDAILLTKPDGSILSGNRSACKLFGMTEDEIRKAGRAGIIDPDDPRVDMLLKQRDITGFAEGEVTFIRKNGTRLTAEITSSLFKNSKGETFSSMIIRDISERKKWERDLLFAKEKAEESDRLKSSFLANMSHEIRTPMNGILGFIDVLNSEDLDEQSRHEYMEVVNLSGQRLLDTINDIVEISKIEAGEQEVRYSVVNIREIIQFHVNFFRLQARQKGIELFSTLPAHDLNMVVETDKYKLDSILTNLIKNAIKFTVKGTIEIGNYVNNELLVFYVKDTGCGIPTDKHNAVFERFVQADMSMSRPYEGSGLGLTISKAYVNLLKGNIWLESEVGKGSTSYFSIPYKPFTEIEKSIRVHIDLPKAYRSENTILIAEDDDTSYRYLEVILKQKNVTLIRVFSGNDAINVLKENPEIAAILMDIKMPGMDGIEATKEIRKFNKTMPIIAQTAYAFSGDEEKALQAG